MTEPSVFDSPKKSERNPILLGMLVVLMMVMGAAGYFGWKSVEVERENERLSAEVESLMSELVEEAEKASREKAQLLTIHQEEVEGLKALWGGREKDWERQLAAREEEHRQRLQRSFDTLATVVNDSGSALDYLQEMEAKVKKGQALESAEMEELKVIAKGLAYLQTQYERPLEEFKDLEKLIEKELAEGSANEPVEERKALRMMLDWKYRERQKAEKDAQLKQEGRREALEGTQQELSVRYARAQQEMAAVKRRFAEHLQKLEDVAGTEKASAAEMASFFEISAEVIKIHQRVVHLQVEPVEPSRAPIFTTPDVPGLKP